MEMRLSLRNGQATISQHMPELHNIAQGAKVKVELRHTAVPNAGYILPPPVVVNAYLGLPDNPWAFAWPQGRATPGKLAASGNLLKHQELRHARGCAARAEGREGRLASTVTRFDWPGSRPESQRDRGSSSRLPPLVSTCVSRQDCDAPYLQVRCLASSKLVPSRAHR